MNQDKINTLLVETKLKLDDIIEDMNIYEEKPDNKLYEDELFDRVWQLFKSTLTKLSTEHEKALMDSYKEGRESVIEEIKNDVLDLRISFSKDEKEQWYHGYNEGIVRVLNKLEKLKDNGE